MLFSTFSCFFCYILMHNKFTPKLSGWKESFYYNHEFCRWNSIRKEWWDICICSMMRLQLEGLLKPGGGNHLKTSLFTCLGVDAGYCQEPQLELLRQSACSISFGLGSPTAWWPQTSSMEAQSPTADCPGRTRWKAYHFLWPTLRSHMAFLLPESLTRPD